jgi:predicted glycosyltransferase
VASTTDSSETSTIDVLLTIQHPAHVHFFKHAIRELERRGHRVHVRALDKDVTLSLLERYGTDHAVIGSRNGSLARLAVSELAVEYRLYRDARRIRPDVMASIGGVEVAHVARLVGARSVVFTDTEHAKLSNAITFPFADEILTPDCYLDDAGSRHHRYPSYHELAYLHPDRFDPDPAALDGLPVEPGETYVVVRCVGWGAAHDVGDEGFEDVAALVERLESTGATVLISAEADIPASVEDRRIDIEPHRMHDLLAFADLFVGESGTMAAESAVLGTPSVYVHSENPGLMRDLSSYGLLFGYHGERRNERAVDRAVDILESPPPTPDWQARRRALLDEKVDATDVIVRRILGAAP